METGVKVWITNYAGHDYEPAKKYGELVHITKGFISYQSLDRLKYRIVEAMLEMGEGDYLLLSGTNIINVIAVAYAMEMFGSVNILVFDKEENLYRELRLSSLNFGEIENVVTGRN